MAVGTRVILLQEVSKTTGRSFNEIYDASRKMNHLEFIGFCYRTLFSTPELDAPIVIIEHDPMKLLGTRISG